MNGYLKGESWRLTMDLRILVLFQQWESSRVITRNHSHCTNIGCISPVNSEAEYCKPVIVLAVWYFCTWSLQWNSVVEFQLCLLTYADPVIHCYLGLASVSLESNSSADLRPLKTPLLTSDMLHRDAQLVRTLPLFILDLIVELQSMWIFLFYR